MTSVSKSLLYLEVIVCFGAPTAILAMGVVLLPLWILSVGVKLLAVLGLLSVLDSGPGWVGPVSIVAVIAGALGMLGVVRLVHLVSSRGDVLARPYRTLGLIVAGLLGIFLYNVVVEPTDPRTDSVQFALLVVLPLTGTAHLLYLARASVFRRRRSY
jgi:hypothetical protein